MKILFLKVDPEGENRYNNMKVYEASDISYIAAILKEKGHNIMVYDEKPESVELDKLDSFEPDIICLPRHTDKKIIEWAKAKRPGAIICKGTGTILNNDVAKCIMDKNDYLDIAIIGGEVFNTWIELVDKLETRAGLNDVKGIMYRQGTELIETGESNDFDINMLKASDSESSKSRAYVKTSSGCIGNCSFCSEKLFHKKWKGRDIESVIQEIRYHTEKGIDRFLFVDAEIEAPDIKLERLTQLCNGIINLKRPVFYRASFRPDFIRKATPGIINLLSASGLYRVFVGVESGSQEDLNIFNKRCTVEEAKATVKLFDKNGIYTEIGFIMFQPFSTFEGLSQNIDVLDSLGKADFNSIASNYISNGCDKLTDKTREAGLYYEENGHWCLKEGKIYPLYIFIKSIFTTLKPAIDKYNAATSHHGWYYYRYRYYSRQGKVKQCEAIQSYLDKVWSIKQSMSVNLCIWFRKLLDIAKEGFDNKKAVDISCNLLNEYFITETAKYIEHEEEKLDNILESLRSEI